MNHYLPERMPENPKNFGEYAYLAIAQHFRKVLQYETEVLKDDDPENLHQMRVSLRRLRSVIIGFAPCLQLPKGAKEDQVGKIGKILGQLRDLDVLQETLAQQYYPQLPKSEKKCLKQGLLFLQHQRKFAFKNVKKLLKGNQYKKFKKAYFSWLENPSFKAIADLSIYPILPDLLFPQLSKFLLHEAWLLGVSIDNEQIVFSPDLNDVKKVETILTNEGVILHDLRKSAKRTRYNMELFTHFYGEEYHKYVSKVKALQTVLGEIQDCYVLSEFLEGIFSFDLGEQMPSLLHIFGNIRYEKWQEWISLQEYFLDLKHRQGIRNVIQNRSGDHPQKLEHIYEKLNLEVPFSKEDKPKTTEP